MHTYIHIPSLSVVILRRRKGILLSTVSALEASLSNMDRQQQVTSVLPAGDVPVQAGAMPDDEAALAALGYKQEFKREFSAWTTFAVSFAVMGLLPSIASTMWYGIGYGENLNPLLFGIHANVYSWCSAGPAANTWGWLISVFFILCVSPVWTIQWPRSVPVCPLELTCPYPGCSFHGRARFEHANLGRSVLRRSRARWP